eukprot:2979935-Rhodomonas_salina.2
MCWRRVSLEERSGLRSADLLVFVDQRPEGRAWLPVPLRLKVLDAREDCGGENTPEVGEKNSSEERQQEQ